MKYYFKYLILNILSILVILEVKHAEIKSTLRSCEIYIITILYAY